MNGTLERRGFWDVFLGYGNAFGRKRKSLATTVLVLGILTFFIPMISTNPPVLGKSHWSVLDSVQHVWRQKLPPSANWAPDELVVLPFGVGFTYLLLLSALVLLAAPDHARKLAWIGAAGLILSSTAWEVEDTAFELTFYGNFSYHNMRLARRVEFAYLVLALTAVTAGLLYIATHESLDADRAAE